MNSIAARFDHSLISVLFRSNHPFKRELVRLLPGALSIECAPNEAFPSLDLINPAPPPLSLFAPALHPWFKGGMSAQDIILPGFLGNHDYVSAIDKIAPLRFSPEDAETCARDLVSKGLDPDRWFCALHAREPGFNTKSQTSRILRDAVPGTFLDLATYIIEELGGQVVRLGHPGMSEFPARKGLIDLSGVADSTLLQAFAISRSRFFYGSPSGPLALADTFQVPAAVIDAVDRGSCNPNLVARTVDLVMPDGRVLRQRELFDAGYQSTQMRDALLSKTGFQVIKNALPEMVRLAKFMHDTTAGLEGWRVPKPADSGPRPNQFIWPPGPITPREQFLPV